MDSPTPRMAITAGVLAAIGASICCVGPLALLGLGISGAWIGTLSAFEPYRPVLIGITLGFLALAFRKLYLVPQVCALEAACAARRSPPPKNCFLGRERAPTSVAFR
jgi:mercuric ion transport protein